MPEMSQIKREAKKYRVFVVDDHPVIRDGLRSLINGESDLVVCGEAAGSAEALSRIPSTAPDIALVDLSLNKGFGLELVKDLAIQHPILPVIVLSMHDEMTFAERALRAGARGYLMKAESSQRIVGAIRHVLAGKVFLSDRVVAMIATKLGNPKHDRPGVERLSDRELEVFEMIGQGLSTAEIAERMCVSVKTVQAYFARAKEKFGVTTAKQLLREAFRWDDSKGIAPIA
jgi:DNA-binding NarL/FixJ family response regulator